MHLCRFQHHRIPLGLLAQQTVCVAVLLVVQGCTTIASLQTARPVDPGKYELVVGSSYGVDPDLGKLKNSNADVPAESYPQLGVRTGLFPRMDAGLRLLGTGITLDSKYALSGTPGWLWVSPGIWYTNSHPWSQMHSLAVMSQDMGLALHASVHYMTWASLYAAPKFFRRQISGAAGLKSYYVGTTLGIKVGTTVGTYLETTEVYNMSAKTMLREYTAAFYVNM